MQGQKVIPRITIGTDPEIIFTDQKGKLLNASSYLNKTDKFGLDGHAWIAELRPDHAVYPRDLVENIRKVLSLQADRLKNLIWLSGPWLKNKPMGGHLHFGVRLEPRFVEALDNQLGFLLALSEPEEGAKMRRTQKFQGSHDDHPYGVLSNIRPKDSYGGFEYRTPASYLASPGIALATITVAKAIIVEEVEKGKMAWSQLTSNLRTELKVNRDDFENCNLVAFQDKLDTYWKVLRGMLYFQKGMEGHDLWPAVSYFKSKVFPLKGFRVGHDIKPQWGFKPVTPNQSIRRKNIPRPYGNFWDEDFRLIKTKATVPLNFNLAQASPAQLTWEFLNTVVEG